MQERKRRKGYNKGSIIKCVRHRHLSLLIGQSSPLYLGVESAALSEKCAGDEPEAVADGELVLHEIGLAHTRMWIVPLVGRETRHDEERETDEHVGRQNVQPNFHCQGIHEGEEPRRLAGRYLNYVTLRF